MSDVDVRFDQVRPRLFGIAYRMLGSVADAEDVVQEAWVRWAAEDRSEVKSPRGFLITVATRLSLDRLRIAARRQESYVGPWLPEPVPTAPALDPAETVAQRDTLSLATLRLMQQLSAPERAVFVLREAFELPYEEIGRVLELGEAHARQLHKRGAARLATGRDRFPVQPQEDGARTDGAPGNYEWWYFDAHLDDGAKVVARMRCGSSCTSEKPGR